LCKAMCSWAYNAHKDNDYGIDYTIELFEPESQNASGIECQIQLKGLSSPRYGPRGQFLTISLKVSHLSYYSDLKHLPVFLVVVDTVRESGYYLNVFDALHKRRDKWRQKKSISLKVPTSNLISSTSQWEQAIRDAHWQQMSPSGSARRFKQLIESGNPTLMADVSTSESHTHVKLTAIKDTDVSLKFGGPPDSRAAFMQAAIGEGRSVRLGDFGVTMDIQGLNLPSAMDPSEIASICFQTRIPGRVVLRAYSTAENQTATAILHGDWVGGTHRIAFDAKLPDDGLSMSFAAMRLPDDRTGMESNVSINSDPWIGKNLLHIEIFDTLQSLLRVIAFPDSSLTAEFYLREDKFVTTPDLLKDSALAPSFRVLGLISRARSALIGFGIESLPMAGVVSETDIQSMITLDTLSNTGEAFMTLTNGTATLEAKSGGSEAEARAACEAAAVKIISNHAIELFGTELLKGRLATEFGLRGSKLIAVDATPGKWTLELAEQECRVTVLPGQSPSST